MPLVDFAGAGFFVPAPQWTEKDIPDLTGRVVVVTGANTGLGKLSARHMLQKGARVYAACRSAEKADEAIRQIKQETGKDDIHFLQLDLSDLHSCLEAGKKLAQQETRLDIALLSAGVMTPPKGSKTAQGLELQFGTNVVGHYAFVRELEPLLIKTASESATASVRVVWLSSVAHDQMSPRDGIHFDTIEKVTACSPEMYYGMSKLADIHMANSMAKRLEQHGILVSSVNPGVIRTDLQRHMHGVRGWLVRMLVNKPQLGVLTQLYAATAAELTMDDSAAYFGPWARKYNASHPKANDPQAIDATFAFVQEIIKKKFGDAA